MNAAVVETESTTTETTLVEPKRRIRHTLNHNQIRNIDIATRVAICAQKPSYKSALILRNIGIDAINELVEEIQLCREALASTRASDTLQQSAMLQERAVKGEILDVLQVVQAAARQKYTRTSPERLRDYFVGERVRQVDRATLVQVVQNVLHNLTTDSLPGVTPEVRMLLHQKCEAYVAADTQQQGYRAAVKDQRVAAMRHLKRLTDLRLEIQFAVDGLYPYTNPESASTRSEFGLPLRRPFAAL